MTDVQILLVDADPASAQAFAGHLRDSGWATRAVGSGAAAVKACQELSPDLLVLEISLPDMDGFRLWPILASCCDPIPPFVFLCESADFESAERGLTLGASDYLVKGRTSGEDLAASVKRVLAGRFTGRHPDLRVLN